MRKEMAQEAAKHEGVRTALQEAAQENQELADKLRAATENVQKVLGQKAQLLAQLKEQASTGTYTRSSAPSSQLQV